MTQKSALLLLSMNDLNNNYYSLDEAVYPSEVFDRKNLIEQLTNEYDNYTLNPSINTASPLLQTYEKIFVLLNLYVKTDSISKVAENINFLNDTIKNNSFHLLKNVNSDIIPASEINYYIVNNGNSELLPYPQESISLFIGLMKNYTEKYGNTRVSILHNIALLQHLEHQYQKNKMSTTLSSTIDASTKSPIELPTASLIISRPNSATKENVPKSEELENFNLILCELKKLNNDNTWDDKHKAKLNNLYKNYKDQTLLIQEGVKKYKGQTLLIQEGVKICNDLLQLYTSMYIDGNNNINDEILMHNIHALKKDQEELTKLSIKFFVPKESLNNFTHEVKFEYALKLCKLVRFKKESIENIKKDIENQNKKLFEMKLKLQNEQKELCNLSEKLDECDDIMDDNTLLQIQKLLLDANEDNTTYYVNFEKICELINNYPYFKHRYSQIYKQIFDIVSNEDIWLPIRDTYARMLEDGEDSKDCKNNEVF